MSSGGWLAYENFIDIQYTHMRMGRVNKQGDIIIFICNLFSFFVFAMCTILTCGGHTICLLAHTNTYLELSGAKLCIKLFLSYYTILYCAILYFTILYNTVL